MNSDVATLYSFRHGLPAFEQDQQFALSDEAEWRPFLVMESLRAGGPRFICIEISAIEPQYTVELSREDADSLGVQPGSYFSTDPEIRSLGIVATAEDGSLTVNLAAPLLLSRTTCTGVQSIQSASRYSPCAVILRGEERRLCS